MTLTRRWALVARELEARFSPDALARTPDTQRLESFLELAWPHLEPTEVSWIGFYLDHPEEPEERRLHLGPCRGGPACSPIGLHGACGRALRTHLPLVVRDVSELGEAYIACDPRDRSELVVPLLEANRALRVLDLDSHRAGAFDEQDAEALARLLVMGGLSHPPGSP